MIGEIYQLSSFWTYTYSTVAHIHTVQGIEKWGASLWEGSDILRGSHWRLCWHSTPNDLSPLDPIVPIEQQQVSAAVPTLMSEFAWPSDNFLILSSTHSLLAGFMVSIWLQITHNLLLLLIPTIKLAAFDGQVSTYTAYDGPRICFPWLLPRKHQAVSWTDEARCCRWYRELL